MYSVNDKSTLLLCYNGYSRYTLIKYKINSGYQKLFQRTFVHENKLQSVSSWIPISSFIPNWKLRPRNCLRKGDDGRARILVSAQEMIIRRRKDRFIAEIVPNVPPEMQRRPPVAAATGLPDICQISPALLLRPPLFPILKNCFCCRRRLRRSTSTSTSTGTGTGTGTGGATYSSVSRVAHNREMHKSTISVQGIFLI